MNAHDPEAERALLGDLLALPHRIEEVTHLVVPSDFHNPANGRVYQALVSLHAAGHKVDHVTVAAELHGDIASLVDVVGAGSGGYRRYAQIVSDMALRRKVIATCAELLEEANSLRGGAVDLVDRAKLLLAGIELPVSELPGDFYDFDEFLDRGIERRSPWVVPGLLRADWRAILVAAEGAGKSVILRSFALMSAQGIHPFAHTNSPQVRTLLVDLENPDDAIVGSCQPIREQARRIGKYQPGRAWLWHRPGGMNLRSRADRATFDAILTACAPQLVCMGPLYKLYRRDRQESDEQAAEGCQQALDDLRTRHGFALFLEHHAPKGQQGTRDMTPYGSSYWLRWPELGIGLEPCDGGLALKRWRGDRLPSSWPTSIRRDPSHAWPWVGRWPDGTRFDEMEGAA